MVKTIVKPLKKSKFSSQSKELQQLRQEINKIQDKWQRALADYQNLEKRFEQEKISLTKFLNAGLIEKMLVILDDLERAAKHVKDKGLTMILNKLTSVLQGEGLQEIEAHNQVFDPVTMDCVDLVHGPNNQVITVVEKGYRLNDRVLRPVKVKVGKGGHGIPH